MPSYFTPSKSRWAHLLRPHPKHEGFMTEPPSSSSTPVRKQKPYYRKASLSTPTLRLIPPEDGDAGTQEDIRTSITFPTLSSGTPLLARVPDSPPTPTPILESRRRAAAPAPAPRSPSPIFHVRADATPPPQLKRLYFSDEPLIDLSVAPIKQYFPAPVPPPMFKLSSTEEVPVFKGRYKLRHKERMSLPGGFCTPQKPMPRQVEMVHIYIRIVIF
ncbi:hypothetical protein BJ912DRAFT_920042 [Pholiota molesta]|nr:hypothetical protein BJ912DRAFT_920042 [Pholiota molesta]